MITVVKRILAGTIAAALLSACGGGGASQSALPASSSAGKTTATFSVKIPGSSLNVRGNRVPMYTSRGAKGIGVDIQSSSAGAFSPAANTSPQFGAAISAGSGSCGTRGSDGSYSCTFSVPAPVGYDSVRVALWNAAPDSGSCAASGANCTFNNTGDESLGVAVSTATVYSGSNNTISGFTLSPIVDSIVVQTAGTIQNGATNSFQAFIVLQDASGNTIVGSDQLIDAAGNSVSVYPAILNNNGGCANDSHGVPLAANSCSLYFASGAGFASASAASSVTVNYDGTNAFPTTGSLPQVFANLYVAGGGYEALPGGVKKATIGVTATSGGVTSGKAPQYGSQAALSGSPAQFSPHGGFLVNGADGYLYVQEGSAGSSSVERFNPSTPAVVQSVSLATGSANVDGIANGTDNALWYINSNTQTIYQQPYGTSSAGAVSVTDNTLGDIVANLVAAPDGNMWFIRNLAGGAGGVLESVTPSMSTSRTSTADVTNPTFSRGALAAGTFPNGDQAVCTGDTSGYVDCWDITGSTWVRYNNGGMPAMMVFGGDGNLYFNDGFPDGTIKELTLSAGVLSLAHSYALAASESPNGLTQGYDGNVWFTTIGGSNYVGRISVESQTGCAGVCAGYLAEWGSATQLPATVQPQQIIAGPDHQIWITSTGTNTVDQILP